MKQRSHFKAAFFFHFDIPIGFKFFGRKAFVFQKSDLGWKDMEFHFAF